MIYQIGEMFMLDMVVKKCFAQIYHSMLSVVNFILTGVSMILCRFTIVLVIHSLS